MKNNYSRFIIIALITIIVFLYAITVRGYAAGLPAALQETVTGTVRDESGMPLPGVSVTVKGTDRGTATNVDGEFQIVVSPLDVLVFSYMGYKKAEILVEGRKQIDVLLESDISNLAEVEINAGYYNTTRRESTGNISRVTAEEIEMQPVVSPLLALQGRMAGVEIIPGGSHPGMAPTIRIRGRNSLREEGNYPLYIIDGMPINSTPIETNSLVGWGSAGIDPLNLLNISSIASIEVLKDADATAIYGSRGANGVVLITTKTGIQRGTRLEISFYTGASTVPNRLDLLNTEEYFKIRGKAFENDGVEPTERNAYDLVLWDKDRYTDWQNFLYGGTAKTTSANVAFSGGNENTSFRFGSSYFSQGTVYPGDYEYQRATGNLSLNHSSENQKFNLHFSVNYGVDVNNLVGNVNFNSDIAFLPPNAPPIFSEDGSLNWEDWSLAGLDNPLHGYFNTSRTQANNLISSVGLTYEFLPGLGLKSNFGYTYYDSGELRKQPRRSYNPSDATTNRSSHLNFNRTSWIVEPQLIYNKNFNRLKIEALIGATLQENKVVRESFQGSGYASEALIGNISAAETILNASSANTKYRYAALFSRVGLDWERKYFINFTGRRDGSSRFGPNNRFANFGAVGAAWVFADEAFIENSLPFLSFGKLRGSYGITGNDQIGDYGYLDAYEPTRGPGGLYPTGLANPDYSWEVNKKFEAGIELGFIDDKISFSLSHYLNRSSNQLVGYSLPYITGFTSVQANLPATVENSGWEVTFNSLNVNNGNFSWETAFNISFPRNELVSYPGIEQSSYANTYRVGHPLNISLLYNYTGLDPETGFYTIRDVNQDGSFDYQDQVVIQDWNAEFYGGINNNISYKNFALQFLWEFAKQVGNETSIFAGTIGNNLDVVLSTFDGQGPYQKISQSLEASEAYSYFINSSLPVQDASYLRLKTLSLNYSLPVKFLEEIRLKSCRLFLHGQNLVTISNYSGFDPEIPDAGIGNLRTITGGIDINF